MIERQTDNYLYPEAKAIEVLGQQLDLNRPNWEYSRPIPSRGVV